MNIFVLALIAATSGGKDIVVPLLSYESKDICEQKIVMLEEKILRKNPAIDFGCYPDEKFKKENQEQNEENKDKGQ
jgi:hypothetical protein